MSRQSSTMPSLVDDHPESTPVAGASSSRAGNFAAGAKRKSQQIKLASAIAMIIIAALVAAYNLFGGGPSAAEQSRRRDLIDAESGEVFLEHKIPEDGRFPYVNPKTGKESLFPVERCYYTKDGAVKLIPTYVLLNSYKNIEGDTKCPDCGRRVVPHNPAPTAELARMAAEKSGEPAAAPPAAEPK